MYIFFKLRLLLHSTAAIICDICSLFIFFIVKNIYDRLKKRCESYEEEFIFDLPIVTESNISVNPLYNMDALSVQIHSVSISRGFSCTPYMRN